MSFFGKIQTLRDKRKAAIKIKMKIVFNIKGPSLRKTMNVMRANTNIKSIAVKVF